MGTVTFAEYAADVDQLVQIAYPTIGADARDILVQQAFCRGLNCPEMCKQLKLSRPRCYADLVSLSLQIEAVNLAENQSLNDRRVAVRNVAEAEVKVGETITLVIL